MKEYIDRHAAIEALRGYFDDQILWDDKGSFVAECCEETINDVPTADVRENVKGEWIEYDSGYGIMAYRCSICGKTTLGAKQYDLYGNEYVYEFCSHCGADMRDKGDD